MPARIFEHDEIVTGEAVALRVHPASPVQLLAAGGIDLFLSIILTLAALLALTLIEPLRASPEAARTYLIGALVFAFIAVPTAVETATGGFSAGRWILGVRIVRDDGGAIRFRHALTRALVGLFEIALTFGSIAVITTIANARHKRLGDLLAGTYPVSVNAAALLPPPLHMPPELVGWAHVVDVSRLPGTLAWRTRQFLNTGAQLAPGIRQAQGQALAAEVGAHVSPPPPEGTHPERFLAAVMVIRRDAEFAAGARTEEALSAHLTGAMPYSLGRG